MRIVHYTDKVRDALHSGYKPAGFLHCAIVEYATSRDDLPLLGYVIYVWDTREVVAYGKARIKNATHGHAESAVGKTAKDSHEQLKGSGDVVADINKSFAKLATESFVPAVEASGTVFAIDRYRQGFGSSSEYYYYETLTTAYTNKDDAKKFLTEQKHCTATRQGYINEKDAHSLYKIKELKLA